MATAPAHQPIRVYADQNFMIYCTQNPSWRTPVTAAHQSGKIVLVLSPWHFYEYGKGAHHADAEDLLKFTEELQPLWIIERADLHTFEFWALWGQIWSGWKEVFDPIGTFPQIVAILAKVAETQAQGITVRDYVTAFSEAHALDEIEAELRRQRYIADFNREQYLKGRIDKALRMQLEMWHLAIQHARLETKSSDYRIVDQRARELLTGQPIATQFQWFIEWGISRDLKCHHTEAALTEELYATGGSLNVGRFVDRQHASVALPYCHWFVTDDRELQNRCARVASQLNFPTAEVITGEELISRL